VKDEQADGRGKGRTDRKKIKLRRERRKAKRDPEVPAGYKRFLGYQL
jgi:hypothetical protein